MVAGAEAETVALSGDLVADGLLWASEGQVIALDKAGAAGDEWRLGALAVGSSICGRKVFVTGETKALLALNRDLGSRFLVSNFWTDRSLIWSKVFMTRPLSFSRSKLTTTIDCFRV